MGCSQIARKISGIAFEQFGNRKTKSRCQEIDFLWKDRPGHKGPGLNRGANMVQPLGHRTETEIADRGNKNVLESIVYEMPAMSIADLHRKTGLDRAGRHAFTHSAPIGIARKFI